MNEMNKLVNAAEYAKEIAGSRVIFNSQTSEEYTNPAFVSLHFENGFRVAYQIKNDITTITHWMFKIHVEFDGRHIV